MSVEKIALVFILTLACGRADELVFSGTMEVDEVRISSRVQGSVQKLLVTQGERVELGQPLVVIDPTEYQLALTKAQAALSMAEANLQTMLEGGRRQEIVSAQSAVSAARVSSEKAEADLDRATELHQAGAVSVQQLQAVEAAAARAMTQYTTARQNYSLLVEGARATELQAAQAAVESAAATVELAENRLGWTEICSPLTGTVTGTNTEEGENTAPGFTLLTVANTDTLKVVFYVSQPYLAATPLGSTVKVSTNSVNGTYEVEGRITFISDQAEFTPSQVETREGRTSLVYRVEAEVPNTQNVFKAGMPVDVELDGTAL